MIKDSFGCPTSSSAITGGLRPILVDGSTRPDSRKATQFAAAGSASARLPTFHAASRNGDLDSRAHPSRHRAKSRAATRRCRQSERGSHYHGEVHSGIGGHVRLHDGRCRQTRLERLIRLWPSSNT